MRVVVVGNGMVGSRFVEDLLAEVADGAALDVTVLGAEEYEPYNRVLLTEVVAGKVDVATLTLPAAPTAALVLPGVVARTIDRGAHVVVDAAGARHPYDALVLATGARARVPDLPGLRAPRTGEVLDAAALPAGVHALRTLDDAREIVAATVNARTAVVLGGGVLGLEAACGLARRGLAVTVVHTGAHLMDRQLDGPAAAAATTALAQLGVRERVGARARDVVLAEGTVVALDVTGADGGGERLCCDLLVLTAGTVPETDLARRAGLPVAHGVQVDATCTTADPAVHAIGDCAEPPEGATGLVAQGWEQGRRLAARLAARAAGTPAPATGSGPDVAGGSDVVRLKAAGLSVVAMGVCGARRPEVEGARTVHLGDPQGGRHVEVVVADGVLVGATCVGDAALAADLTAAYTRRTPVPADPAQLLLRPVRGAAAGAPEPSPTLMPDRATVCRCNGVTKGDVVGSWEHGARSVEDVARRTRATTGCGGCTDAVCGLVDWLRRSDPSGAGAPADASGEGAAAPVPVPQGR